MPIEKRELVKALSRSIGEKAGLSPDEIKVAVFRTIMKRVLSDGYGISSITFSEAYLEELAPSFERGFDLGKIIDIADAAPSEKYLNAKWISEMRSDLKTVLADKVLSGDDHRDISKKWEPILKEAGVAEADVPNYIAALFIAAATAELETK